MRLSKTTKEIYCIFFTKTSCFSFFFILPYDMTDTMARFIDGDVLVEATPEQRERWFSARG